MNIVRSMSKHKPQSPKPTANRKGEDVSKDNMRFWDKLKKPPTNMLKKITFGAMKGKSSIDPVWRMKAITEVFGPVGFGWNYEILRKEVFDVSEGQKLAVVDVRMWLKDGEAGSRHFDGTGSSMLISIANRGKSNQYMNTNDEAFKMATTDALSVCFKATGAAAEIYLGHFDGVKYFNQEEPDTGPTISDEQLADLESLSAEVGAEYRKFCDYLGVAELHFLPAKRYEFAVSALESKRGK